MTALFGRQNRPSQRISARGYISASENIAHIGLGAATLVDSVVVRWNDKTASKMSNIAVNQTVILKYGENTNAVFTKQDSGLFAEIDSSVLGFSYRHTERDFVDFDVQRTLPHKFSQYGPGLAVADINGDGQDDVYLSGTHSKEGCWLIQTSEGRFIKKTANYKTDPGSERRRTGCAPVRRRRRWRQRSVPRSRRLTNSTGFALFFQDVLWVNDGKGNFTQAPDALPKELASGQCVKAADFDGDGDLDLFVGGRVLPLSYPKTDRSFLLRNDAQGKDQPRFTDVTRAGLSGTGKHRFDQRCFLDGF